MSSVMMSWSRWIRYALPALLILLNSLNSHANTHPLFNQINSNSMWNNLKTLTRFPDRDARSENGLAAATWIKQQVEHMMRMSKRQDSRLYSIDTQWMDKNGRVIKFQQPSIMLRIGSSHLPGIVIGAHFDTVDCNQHACTGKGFDKRPGADDNGSGTVTLLEMARILLNSHMKFKQPIYIAWYASEENDLDGSKSVVNYFRSNKIPVLAVMQLDMTGEARNNDSTIWISDTGHYQHVNKYYTELAYRLAKTYTGKQVQITHLDDESDHWSWHEAGYKTVYPAESDCHGDKIKCPYREHTANDTIDKLSLSHMVDYLKLALAFTTELAKPL